MNAAKPWPAAPCVKSGQSIGPASASRMYGSSQNPVSTNPEATASAMATATPASPK